METIGEKWPPNNISFINIHIYPLDIKLFKPYLPAHRKIFEMNIDYVKAAKQRMFCSTLCQMIPNGVRKLWSTSKKISTTLEPEKQLIILKGIKKAI